jgi:hypothetical protein
MGSFLKTCRLEGVFQVLTQPIPASVTVYSVLFHSAHRTSLHAFQAFFPIFVQA